MNSVPSPYLVPLKPHWMPFSITDSEARVAIMLALAALAGFLVYALSPRVVAWCSRHGLMSTVNDRSSHTRPTPHGGGVILPLVVVPLALAITWLWPLPFKGYLSVMFMGSLLVAYVGWLDDRHELSARLRLLVHLGAVAMPLLLLPRLFEFMPLPLEKAFLILGWAWFVNLYNFMDGADGHATSQAIAMALALSVIVPVFAPVGLIIAAAATGFLRVNGPPAKVFMGDVCATWLGYILCGLYLVSGVDDTVNISWPLATLPLVFAADATTTLARRILQGHKPWEPHKTFWFHRYLALGHTHRQLVGRVALLNLTLFAVGFGSYLMQKPFLGFCTGVLVICAAACYIRSHEAARTGG